MQAFYQYDTDDNSDQRARNLFGYERPEDQDRKADQTDEQCLHIDRVEITADRFHLIDCLDRLYICSIGQTEKVL